MSIPNPAKAASDRPFGRLACGAAALALMALAAGCSPYLFSSEIESFDASTAALGASAETMRQGIVEGAEARGFWALYDDPDKAQLSDGCSLAGAGTCEVTLAGESAIALTMTEAKAIEGLRVFGAFRSYAAALKAITNKEDRQRFDAANAALAKSVGGFLAIVPSFGAAAAKAAEAVVRAAGVAVAFSEDVRRRRTLEAAVLEVNPHMQDAADELASALNDFTAAERTSLEDRLDRANEAMRSAKEASERQRLIREVFALQGRIQALDAANAGAVAASLVAAHSALAEALRSADPDFETTLAAIQQFADAAQGLREAFAPL